ncbi:MAG TPA: rhodanese-like domain-containing protein [Actinomycetota bacterium]|jgi:rhodanese-related sulfurtransferase
MTPEEAAAARDSVFLDVREPYEWDAGHIDGSVHIPIGQIQERFEEVERERPVVVVCQVGQRSALVADFLSAQGYDAANLEGGLEAWSANGLPLVTDDDAGGVVDGWARGIDGHRLDGTVEGD